MISRDQVPRPQPHRDDSPGDRPLRVLHVSSGNLYGGVERVLATIAEQRFHEPRMLPTFALSFDGRNAAELRASGTPVEMLGEVRLSRPWTMAAARQRLRRVVARLAPDVLVCHNPWAFVVFGAARLSGDMPRLLWLHGILRGRNLLERYARLVRPPDYVIANSRYTSTAVPLLYPRTPTHVVYNPVPLGSGPDPDRREAIRSRLGVPAGTLVIIQVSRLEAGKGHHVLIDALGRLPGELPWECWIVGGVQRSSDRSILDELEQEANQRQLTPRIRLLGERSDVRELLGAADVFCQPNLLPESFGLSYVEALAAGLPVVTSAIGGALEIVDETCGLLVPPGDAAALARALHLLLGDEALRLTLGRNGLPRARALCDPAQRLNDLHRFLASVRDRSANA